MMLRASWLILIIVLSLGFVSVEAQEEEIIMNPTLPAPLIGSWVFSGMVTNESGDPFGYFFQLQRQDDHFYVKTALIDGHTNQLVFFYDTKEKLVSATPFNWRVGDSFLRYNPINASWIFGVKLADQTGFNFKADMLQASSNHEASMLRPGVELQVLQTSRLNGHIRVTMNEKEQFITGHNAWFAKVWFSKEQSESHDINTVFCRLENENSFYSASLKEKDATDASVAEWRDPLGNKVKMSQFISMQPLTENRCMIKVGLPKINLKLTNTLKQEANQPFTLAGFSAENPKGFCFAMHQSFFQLQESLIPSINIRSLG